MVAAAAIELSLSTCTNDFDSLELVTRGDLANVGKATNVFPVGSGSPPSDSDVTLSDPTFDPPTENPVGLPGPSIPLTRQRQISYRDYG